MGSFKPMVKMETTEPSVELKLKSGGFVAMKKGGVAEAGHKKMAGGGGAMAALMGTPALVGRPAVNAPVRTPGKPSMAQRRAAMMAPKAVAPPMKKGGKADESKADEKAEAKKIDGIEKELKSHESKPASKGHKGLKSGGVAKGNAAGFKTGGVAKGQGGFKDGGDMSKGAYDAHYANEKADNESTRNMVLDAPKKLVEGVKGLFGSKAPSGSVTKTEKSVTVAPGKKSGGKAC